MGKSDLAVDHGEEVLRLIGEVGQAFRKTLPSIIRIGELLTEQKKALPHGQFIPWLEKLGVSQRSARRYMWAYKRRDDPKLASASNLAEAERLLSPPKTAKLAVLPRNPPESNGSGEGETQEVIETEGETVPEPKDPSEEVAPEVIDTSDPVFSDGDEDEPASERLDIKELVARSGMKPMNWTSPEGVDPREKFKTLSQPPPEAQERPEETHEGFEAYVTQDEPRVPLQDERDALPDEVVELVTEVIELAGEEKLVKFLGRLKEKLAKD